MFPGRESHLVPTLAEVSMTWLRIKLHMATSRPGLPWPVQSDYVSQWENKHIYVETCSLVIKQGEKTEPLH